MRKNAFTLAEVLITLGIIGVVAAITLPSFINHLQDRQYKAARKKALVSIGEAARQIAAQGEMNDALSAEDFVENYLNKKLKIIKTCNNGNLRNCGLETGQNKITTFTGGKMTMPKKWSGLAWGFAYGNGGLNIDGNMTSYDFVMSNGYPVNLFYNPKCTYYNPKSYIWATSNEVCVHAIYDMNGLAKPKRAGKDIGFVTVFYPNERSIALAPNVYKINAANVS